MEKITLPTDLVQGRLTCMPCMNACKLALMRGTTLGHATHDIFLLILAHAGLVLETQT